jgi:hypothetical protein
MFSRETEAKIEIVEVISHDDQRNRSYDEGWWDDEMGVLID